MKGEFAALITAICWTFNSLSFSIAGRIVGSKTVNHIRLWIAFLAMGFINFLSFSYFFPFNAPFKSIIFLSLSGFIGFAIGDAALFESLVLLGPRLSMTIMATNPIIGAILSFIFLNERLKPLHIIAIIVTISAVMFVVSEKHENENFDKKKRPLGVLLAAIGSICQATGMLLSKIGLSTGLSVISGNMIRVTSGLFFIVLISLFQKEFINDFKSLKKIKGFLFIFIGAILGPVLGVMLALYAISRTQIGIATTITSISPILLIPLSALIYKEKVTIRMVAGTIITIAGASALFFI
ncbi:MAG: DMT family transporter [Exilispira sp.]